MYSKYEFLDYLETLENCRNAEDELFYLNTKTEYCCEVSFCTSVKYTRKRKQERLNKNVITINIFSKYC